MINTIIVLLAVSFAYLVTRFIIPMLILFARVSKVYDKPDGMRKIHRKVTPTLGGVAVFVSFIVAFSASTMADQMGGYGPFVAASVILFGIGLKDDLIGLSPKLRFITQFIASVIMIVGASYSFNSLGGVFGFTEIPFYVGYPLAIFTLLVVINAFNLIDGVDGLAGGIALIASVFFGSWFLMAGEMAWAVFSFTLASAILGFLWFNFHPAKIFMGDTGSITIGFFVGLQAIQFVRLAVDSPSVVGWQAAAPVLAVAALIVPLFDTLRSFVIRVWKGKSPFAADRYHIHHLLLDMGFTHRQVSLTLYLVTMGMLLIAALASSFLSVTMNLLLVVALSVISVPFAKYLHYRSERRRKLLELGFVAKEGKVGKQGRGVPSGARSAEDLLTEQVEPSDSVKNDKPKITFPQDPLMN